MDQSSVERTEVTNSGSSIRAWIGIDVSQKKLDVALIRLNVNKAPSSTFDNTDQGFAKMMAWLKKHLHGNPTREECHFCLEATGTYSNAVANFLAEAEQRLSLVNPRVVNDYARYRNRGNKTDKGDALLLAEYCQKEVPELWIAALPEIRELQALTRRIEAVKDLVKHEKGRLSAPGLTTAVRESLESTIKFLEEEIERLKKQISDLSDNHPDLKHKLDLLQSIPGIALTTACHILAELPDVSQMHSAQSAAAYAGLAPSKRESGTSLNQTRINKAGNSRLRMALFMPALSAKQYNPYIKVFYERLLANQKHKKAALVAAMRKLLMICVGVLKSGRPFQAPAATA